ncbi:MAG: aminotransferase class V-fold PLP-dependent enzyme [Planctomycetota bacterium]|nr:aminotransferase class V-fold PLP-dependent enzyme [Planctomycetota bacterium]
MRPAMPEFDWNHFREFMPVSRKWAYFDHAAVSPLCQPAQAAIEKWAAEAVEQGGNAWPQWAARTEKVRQYAADLIGAQTDEIAIIPNTTAGINYVAEGYPWKNGDNLVTLANEFPSNLYPWMNLSDRGVETRTVPVKQNGQVDLNRIAEACDERTRILSVSWVGYATGWRNNLEQISRVARDQGVLLFVDAIQGLGVFPLDVRQSNIDMLAADGHKWLLGPEGAGIFYLRKELLQLLKPRNVGWNSVSHAHDFSHIALDMRESAARYEGGSWNMAGITALGASIKLLTTFGLTKHCSPVADRLLAITDEACQRLHAMDATVVSVRDQEHASGIVAFELPGQDPYVVRKRCLSTGVAISCRAGRLRISPHAYNNSQDIERLIRALQIES